ncbi:MAG TPA: hypothetical protein VK461_00825 [Acidimicrobiales bacterium]|nr:hypothetical protein [Acidimicrobiales bacterium]
MATVPSSWSCRQRNWSFGASLREQLVPHGDRKVDSRLVGYSPLVELSRGRVALHAARRCHAQVVAAQFDVDDTFMSVLRCQDRLHLVRAASGDLAVSVLREGRLVMAFGALTQVRLGDHVSVRAVRRHGVETERQELGFTPRQARRNGWQLWDRPGAVVEVFVDGDTRGLSVGESADLMRHHVWVGRGVECGCPGTLESMAVSNDALCPKDVAMHSAQLVGRVGALGLTAWPD